MANASFGVVSASFKHGLPQAATTIDGAAVVQTKGNIWYVNPGQAVGSNGSGTSWSTAFMTMAEAFEVLESGDVIFVSGFVREQLVTPVQVFDVRVYGIGPRPRHADATPVGGNQGTASWGAPASGAVSGQATVRVLQQGWEFYNILFTAQGSTAAMIEIVRDAGSGNDERDASHAVIRGCKFAGAGVGIRSGVAGTFTENTHNVLVEGNTFLSNTTAILQTAGFGGVNWQIKDNDFITCTNDIVGPFSASKILFNRMSLAPTASIVLTNGAGNMVHGNYLPGTYEAGTVYAGGTGDVWSGNYTSVDATTSPAGVSVLPPD